MEGKGVLFKKFAGIDVFDIEINEKDPDKLVEIIAALEPTFGGINLEDIKAPDCFYVERKLRERMKIPVFHDDQHGTAIVVGAAILNGLKVAGKTSRRSSWSPRARAPPRWPAWACWSSWAFRARTSG
jgi:malate dehydrogenase (oxaloacetate-decarboxylating)(NADP+)